MTALLLSIVDTGISQIDRNHNAYGQLSDAATTTMTPRPTADNKSIQTNSGTSIQLTLTGTDPIPGDALKFSVLALTQHGTLTSGATSNGVDYTPNTGFSGTDSFTYKTTDGQGVDSNIATVSITVNAPTPRPTADNKNILANSGPPVQITLTGTDPIPGDALKFSMVGNPQHGTITPGTVSSFVFYTPNTGFSGTDSFTYKTTDGQGLDSNIATATITVNATPPTADDVITQTTSGSNVWSGFGTLGGNLLGDPAVARNSDGRLEVFVIGADHALYHKSQILAGGSSGWTGYSTLGGNIIGNPVVAQNTDGRLEVFVIGADHALLHLSQLTAGSTSWSGFTSLGGYIISNPAVNRNSDGRLEVFVIGSNHALYHKYQLAAGSTNSWSGYTSLGGYIISNPVAGQNSDGRLEVFVIGSDHALYHIFQLAASSSNSWSGFRSLGGNIISDPAVTSNSDGRLEVFVIQSDHALYHIFQLAASSSNSWSGYAYLGGSILGNTNPAAALNSQGQLQVFVVGTNKSIMYKFQITPGSSSWTQYAGLGGFVISNPVVAKNADSRLELFVIEGDHALYHNSQLSAVSSGTLDKFGIKELYPTKANGEQWYFNMQNPTSDPQFNPNGVTLTKNADGSYQVTSSSVRLQVYTSSGYHQNLITTYDQQMLAQKGYMQSPNDWKNVEMTGYMKVNHFTTSTTNGAAHIELLARGGTHTSSVPCEGTAYHSNTYETGRVKFEKELEHTAGYTTNDPEISGVTGTLQGKWIGFKAVFYTFPNGTVKLEQ